MSALANFSRNTSRAMPHSRSMSCVGALLSHFSKSADTCSFDLCTAGAMMWNGVSPANWMMYSPRSVSTVSMPSRSRMGFSPISSLTIDLLLIAIRTPWRRAMSTTMELACAASSAKWTYPPLRRTDLSAMSR